MIFEMIYLYGIWKGKWNFSIWYGLLAFIVDTIWIYTFWNMIGEPTGGSFIGISMER